MSERLVVSTIQVCKPAKENEHFYILRYIQISALLALVCLDVEKKEEQLKLFAQSEQRVFCRNHH